MRSQSLVENGQFESLAIHAISNSQESSSLFNSSENENDGKEHNNYGSLNRSFSNERFEIVVDIKEIQLADQEKSINKKKQARIDAIRSAMEHDGDSTWSL